jgi:hypothetical protein
VFLVLLIAGDVFVAKADHEGRRLVHEFGTSTAALGPS